MLLRCAPPVFDRASDSDELVVRLPLRTRAELDARAREYDMAPGLPASARPVARG